MFLSTIQLCVKPYMIIVFTLGGKAISLCPEGGLASHSFPEKKGQLIATLSPSHVVAPTKVVLLSQLPLITSIYNKI